MRSVVLGSPVQIDRCIAIVSVLVSATVIASKFDNFNSAPGVSYGKPITVVIEVCIVRMFIGRTLLQPSQDVSIDHRHNYRRNSVICVH